MYRRFVNHRFWLCLALVLLLCTACEEGPLPPVKIAPIAEPVASLPELPERASLTVATYAQLLPDIKETKRTLERLGGQMDMGFDRGALDCQTYFDSYREVAGLPVVEVTSDDALTQHTAEEHNTAVSHVLETSRDLYLHCGEALKGTATDDYVPTQQGALSRWGVAESVDRLETVLWRLNEEQRPEYTDYQGVEAQLLQAIEDALHYMELMGGEFDQGSVTAPEYIEFYDKLQALPEFDVSALDPVSQHAYAKYREAVDHVLETSKDQYLHAKDFLVSGEEFRWIPTLTWSIARKGIADASSELHQVIDQLSSRGY